MSEVPVFNEVNRRRVDPDACACRVNDGEIIYCSVHAAAPTLLAALKALEHEADDFDYGDSAPELVAAIVQARDAIKQAKETALTPTPVAMLIYGRGGNSMSNWHVNSAGYLHRRAKGADGRWHWIKQHRVVMEEHLGRPLESSEIVHHLNGVRTDNRVENLCLHTRPSHAVHHVHETLGVFIGNKTGIAALVQWNHEHGPWNKGTTGTVWLTCPGCGEHFQRLRREWTKNQKRGWLSYCSKSCRSQATMRNLKQAKGEA